MINEILSFLDSKSVASFFCTNKEMALKANNNAIIKKRITLLQELKKSAHKERKYYNSQILHLSSGDRIHDQIHNYRVRYACKKFAILNIVDMLGNILDDEYVYTVLHKFKKMIGWATWHKYDESIIIIRLAYGIIKHTCGPVIQDVDSHYLNHITTEQHILIPHYIGEPEVNMLVTVAHKWNTYEYVIINVNTNTVLLKHLHDIVGIESELRGTCTGGGWVVDKRKYSIMSFGGFKYQ